MVAIRYESYVRVPREHFSEDFRQLSKGFRRFSKIVPMARGTFSNIFRKFLKIAEDFRGRPQDVSIIHKRI